MESATSSYYLGRNGILNGDLVNLPYRILQKYSIMLLGLSSFSVKLPSVLAGLVLGFLLILLLNRWFRSNVSLLASTLIVLSTPFLFLAGSGTPLIMLVLWPTLLLWLGSKIQGEKRPKPLYSFVFAIIMLLSIFTPYMIYFAVFCVVFVLAQPHLRFIVKHLPKIPFFLVIVLILGGFAMLGIGIHNHPETIMELLFYRGFRASDFFPNIATGLAPILSWRGELNSVLLTPLIGLPVFALAFIGLFSTTKGFFASRNSIASILIVFCLFITGFDPNAIVFFILPLSILVAHGLKYLLEKWYGLFPENPYARIFALFPLSLLFGVVIVPELAQYINGYRYNPYVADEFNYSISIIRNNVSDYKVITRDHLDFYKILEESTNLQIADSYESGENVAFLGKPDATPSGYVLSRIITSPMRDNSDIIYLYTFTEKKEGE